MYDLLCKEFLDPVLGTGIGNDSDGDSRRRKFFLAQSSDANNRRRFKPVPIFEGFLLVRNWRWMKEMSYSYEIYQIQISYTIIRNWTIT